MTDDNRITHELDSPDSESLPLLEIARGLAHGVRTLVPTCTAGVVVGIGTDWQLLAQAGPIDLAASWRQGEADDVRDNDVSLSHTGSLVAPFAAVSLHALLVLRCDGELPPRAHEVVQPLLDAGGILLDRALGVQARDRTIRRVVLLCQERNGRRWTTLDELQRVVSSLWPDAHASFHDRTADDGVPWAARRLVRTACSGGRPAVGRTPTHSGLLPPGLKHQVAIPLSSLGGSLLVETWAGGEELDHSSLAAAIALTRGGRTLDHAATVTSHV
jgi:hypothetical protein